jgi:hypothetical protein
MADLSGTDFLLRVWPFNKQKGRGLRKLKPATILPMSQVSFPAMAADWSLIT